MNIHVRIAIVNENRMMSVVVRQLQPGNRKDSAVVAYQLNFITFVMFE